MRLKVSAIALLIFICVGLAIAQVTIPKSILPDENLQTPKAITVGTMELTLYAANEKVTPAAVVPMPPNCIGYATLDGTRFIYCGDYKLSIRK
jgi:hypothetical protein